MNSVKHNLQRVCFKHKIVSFVIPVTIGTLMRLFKNIFVLLFIVIHFFGKVSATPTKTIDSLHQAISQISDPLELSILYSKLVIVQQAHYPDSVELYLNKAIFYSQDVSDDLSIGNLYHTRAKNRATLGKHDAAIKDCRKALVFYVKAEYKLGYISVYQTIADILSKKNQYRQAVNYFQKSMDVAAEIDDENAFAIGAKRIGDIYFQQYDYSSALSRYSQSYFLFRDQGDRKNEIDAQIKLGLSYECLLQLDTAIYIYKKALESAQTNGDKRQSASIQLNIAQVCKKNRDYKSCLEFLYQALQSHEELYDVSGSVFCLNNIAGCYIKTKLFELAERYLKEAISLSEAYGMGERLLDAYVLYTELEAERKDFKKLVALNKEFRRLNDSIHRSMTEDKLQYLKTNYLMALHENETLRKTHEEEINQMIIKEREKNMMQYISIIGMVLLLFVLIIYIVFFVVRKEEK